MGLSVGAVIIRQSLHKFTDEDIVKTFFTNNFTEIAPKDLYESKFDIRNAQHVAIYRTSGIIALVNSRLTSTYFNKKSERIKQTYQYFKHPRLIFAFENYDSGDTYGYAIIENGKLVRACRSTVDDQFMINLGRPLNVENKIIKAKKRKETDEDGEVSTIYTHPDTQQQFLYEDMPLLLLREVMCHELEMYPDTFEDVLPERKYFQLKLPAYK